MQQIIGGIQELKRVAAKIEEEDTSKEEPEPEPLRKSDD